MRIIISKYAYKIAVTSACNTAEVDLLERMYHKMPCMAQLDIHNPYIQALCKKMTRNTCFSNMFENKTIFISIQKLQIWSQERTKAFTDTLNICILCINRQAHRYK